MSNNIITEFYSAFEKLDAEEMVKCYHDEIIFKDPAFGQLSGDTAKNMWRMLCQNLKDKPFKLELKHVQADDETGRAQWCAEYVFSITGRKVYNQISAVFRFENGQIIEHSDNFNLYKWARQAFGITGILLGWTPWFKHQLNKKTSGLLAKFEKRHYAG